VVKLLKGMGERVGGDLRLAGEMKIDAVKAGRQASILMNFLRGLEGC
jgi:hypothetical protein